MATASFRFYAELNDFLPAQQRRQDIPIEFLPPCPVRHLIETFGNDVNLMDVEPGPLHYELPEKTSQTNRARTSRVHGGRRRVRGRPG